MSGGSALLNHRLLEIVRTWRIWVLPGLLVLFAVSGPLVARFSRELLGAALGAQAQGLPIPDPTYLDAYGQWAKNLTQLVVLVLVIQAAGSISGEVRSGTAILLLTKPVSRTAFVLATLGSQVLLVVGATAVTSVLTWGMTAALFPAAPAGPLVRAAAAWLVIAALILAATVLASAALDATAGAAGIGIGVYLALAVLAAWPPLARYTPAGLLALPGSLAAGQQPEAAWPVVTGVLAAAVLAGAAVATFRRREL